VSKDVQLRLHTIAKPIWCLDL